MSQEQEIIVQEPVFKSASTFFIILSVALFIFNLFLFFNKNFRHSFYNSLEPKGNLEIVTQNETLKPAIYLDLEYIGKAPLTKSDLVEGKHIMKVENDSYAAYYQEITILPDKTLKVFLATKDDKKSLKEEELKIILTPTNKSPRPSLSPTMEIN